MLHKKYKLSLLIFAVLLVGFSFISESNQSYRTIRTSFNLVPSKAIKEIQNPSPSYYILNDTFISDLRYQPNKTLQQEIFDAEVSAKLKGMWDARTQGYEYRRQWGLTNSVDDLAQINSMGNLSTDVVNEVKSYHMGKEVDKVGKAVDRDPFLSKMKAPAAIVAGAVAIYHGRPINFKLTQASKLSLRTEVEKQIGEVGIQSPLINTSMGFYGKARSERDSTPILPVEDRFKIGVSRQIFGLGAGLNYGTSTRNTGTSLSRRISNHVSCTLDSSKKLGPEGQNKSIAQTLRFDYGIHF